MSSDTPYALRPSAKDRCTEVPEFERLNYFYGQMLGAHDFQREQAYFREKLKLHNRCLHGYGVVCGLEVGPVPAHKPCDETDVPQPQDEGKGGDEAARKRLAELTKEIQELTEQLQADPQNDAIRVQLEKDRQELTELRKQLSQGTPDDVPGDSPGGYRADQLLLACGLALDCEGNELVVRRPVTIDLARYLSDDERKQLAAQPGRLYVSICYCEQPTDPVRPVLPDFCGATPDCTYGRWRDSFRIQVRVAPPEADVRCDSCCTPCEDPCLLLAEIAGYQPGRPLRPQQIHNQVRRALSSYVATVITGISWTHGATYSQAEAKLLLGTDDQNAGLEIALSADVRTATLAPGVVDIWVIAGGKGQSGNIYHMDGAYLHPSAGPYTRRIRYRQASGETLQSGDRVLITVRGSFILDACCRPLDGAHTGGRLPLLDEYRHFHKPQPDNDCALPPSGIGPWTTGNGAGGSTFESWFYVS